VKLNPVKRFFDVENDSNFPDAKVDENVQNVVLKWFTCFETIVEADTVACLIQRGLVLESGFSTAKIGT